MRLRRPAPLGVIALTACIEATAHAQGIGAGSAVGPQARSVDVSGTLAWVGGRALGSQNAGLTPNAVGDTTPFVLFKTDSRLEASFGYGVRLGFNLTRVIAAEAGFMRSRPSMRIKITDDAEGATATVISGERQSQYFLDAGVVVHLTGLRFGRRFVPYAAAGVGQARQLYGDAVLLERGRTSHAGGGVKFFARSRSSGFLRDMGVRSDLRAYVQSRRLDFSNKTRVTVVATVGGFMAF